MLYLQCVYNLNMYLKNYEHAIKREKERSNQIFIGRVYRLDYIQVISL